MATKTYPASAHSAMEFLKHKKFCAAVTCDFASVNAASSDVYQVIPVGKGIYITDVFMYVDTSSAASTAALFLGDGANTSAWDASVTPAVAGVITKSLEATDAYGVGKLYTAADTIDIAVSSSTCTDAKVTVIAEGVAIPQYA